MREFEQHLRIPLILMGDFNEVVNMEERRNSTQVTIGMRDLGDLIQDLDLFYLDINQKYTWMRENAASRLDRIMVSKEVIERFQNLKVHCKERLLSDHFLVVLNTSRIIWGPVLLDHWMVGWKSQNLWKYSRKNGFS